MIKANELRAGNFISDSHGRILQVHEIKQTGVRCLYEGLSNTENERIRNSLFAYDDELWGFPLTPALLEKCGFEIQINDNDIHYIIINPMLWLIIIGEGNIHLILASAEWLHDLQTRVFNLHQLQNLYFALTGEELTIKL